MATTPEAPDSDHIRVAAAAALADVNALDLEGDDRAIVLKALLAARLGHFAPAVSASLSAPAATTNTGREPATSSVAVAEGDVMGRLSTALGMDRDTLELVYAVQDGEPNIVLSPKKISPNKALAARQLGQLVATARQIAGIEEWTSASVIRKVVADYGRLDSGNFAASLQQMDSVAVLRGRGQGRELKITKPGLEATADLIKTLVGAGS